MKVIVNFEGNSMQVEVSKDMTASDLKNYIAEAEGVPPEMQKVVFVNKEIPDDMAIEQCGVIEGSQLDINFGILGGAGAVEIPDHLRELATKFKCNKTICRKCYARNPPNAKNCRKRKCGHCANIRPKKKLKEKEGKK